MDRKGYGDLVGSILMFHTRTGDVERLMFAKNYDTYKQILPLNC